ncbi:hypothetical protein TSAR_010584 [Trichomalopsis sarcophagae]|uniref:Uncharacterized protein n=1 Tax=Trichomalopsis sarcophagae TaxID=543379 RepID=A0A232EDS6_9HYME|nr:hypothetical protein TSAR_010584 [Trichomalopsis sarcophagae]
MEEEGESVETEKEEEEEEEIVNGEAEEGKTVEEEEKRHKDDEEMDVEQNDDIRQPGERFIIHGHETHYVAKYRLDGRRLLLKIRSPPDENMNPIIWLELAIRNIYAYLISLTNQNDMISIFVRSVNFAHGPGGLSLRPVNNFLYNDLWVLISGLSKTNADFVIDESFILTVALVNVPVGERGKKLSINSVSKRSIVSICNNDNLCLPRALVVGEAFISYKKSDRPEEREIWKTVRDGRRCLQKTRANLLLVTANVTIPLNGCGIPEI